MKTTNQILKSEEKLKREFYDSKQKKSVNIKKSIEAIDLKIKNLEAHRNKLQLALQENEIRKFISPIPSTEKRQLQSEESKLLNQKSEVKNTSTDSSINTSSGRIEGSHIFG